MPTTTETVIVSALKSGNLRRAVELMLDSYQEELFGYCARLTGAGAATAVYQRVLATALQEIFSLGGGASIRAWLFQIARGAILLHHRANHRDFPAALQPEYIPIVGPEEPTPRPARDEAVARGTARLDPATAEVLQLALWHGLQLAEVAYVVGRREGEVRRMATHGLGLLDLELARNAATAPS